MLSPDRFALHRTPSPPPTPPYHSPTPNPTPNPSPRRSSSCPHSPRRRGRPPKRKRTTASGSAVGVKLPPWPRSPHHGTDANAPPPPPPPRRGRGRPRKNLENVVYSEVKAPRATEPVPRPRLIIRRLQSKPSNSVPDTFADDDVSGMTTASAMGTYCLRDGITSECDSRNVDGLKGDEKPFPANACKKEESPPPASALPAAWQLELKELLLPPGLPPAAWQQAELGEEPVPPAQLLPETDETSLPLVSLHSEPEVEMLLLDQMQPEPEGALLLLRPEPELLPLAPKQPKSNEEQSLLTPLLPETKGKQYISLPARMQPKSKESSLPPAAQPDAESVVLPASARLEPDGESLLLAPLQLPKPIEEPFAPGLLQLNAEELKEECLSSSSMQPKFHESYFPPVSVHPEPWKELLLLDTMQPKSEEELLQLLPLQSDTEVELLLLSASMQSELHEEQMLSISTQPEPAEQVALPASLRIELTEVSPHVAPGQPEPVDETSVQPEPDEGSFQTAQLLSEPKEELLPATLIEPKEELLPLATIEPEGTEESSPPAPVLAVEKAEKNGHSSKHRRTHAKHRRLWFEC
ncbi:ras-associated and pleckstrin domains-containing protein 1 [Cocos nucifera]|uniref:Ras-associated and pleckstrin domains-containing protein 1 n=1 Tax=Cocos nucifera TaxID=13894 RepID=A0A8K0IYN6_COCNU|nr:ras-associated and pleckstrin domains-containing protein 1 [Cocos nucifera]